MADTGTTGAAERGLVKGMGWRVRMALAGGLRIVPFAAAMVLMGVLWGACGGGLYPRVTSSSSSGTATPGSGSFFYVTNFASGTVAEYHRNPRTGALTSFTTISAGANKGPVGLVTAATPTPFIYVANSASNAVYQYAINLSSGGLSAIGSGSVAAGTDPQWVAVTPAGTYAYATNFGTNTQLGSLSLYMIDSSTGALTANTPSTVTTAVAHPAGAVVGTVAGDSFLYVTDQGHDDIISYQINTVNGTLESPSAVPLGTGGVPGPVIIDASGNFAYATDTELGLVYAFQQSISGLVLINSYSSATVGTNSSMGLTTVITQPEGNEYLYVANEASNSITQFQVVERNLDAYS